MIKSANEKMKNAVERFHTNLKGIRAGKATPELVKDVKVEVYGTTSPLSQIADILVNGRQLTIQPWDSTQVNAIVKAIGLANLGLPARADRAVVRVDVPSLTQDRRNEVVKLCKKELEDCKVSIRKARQEANDTLKKQEKGKEITEDDFKRTEKEVQHITDKFCKEAEALSDAKEKEILAG